MGNPIKFMHIARILQADEKPVELRFQALASGLHRNFFS